MPEFPAKWKLSLLDTTYALTYDYSISTLSASEARANLYRLIDEAAESHVPIRITGKRNNAVLVSEDDWASVQETMYLISIPGMRESIREGIKVGVEECEKKLGWWLGELFLQNMPRKTRRKSIKVIWRAKFKNS